jgi:leucyl aminopeptidase
VSYPQNADVTIFIRSRSCQDLALLNNHAVLPIAAADTVAKPLYPVRPGGLAGFVSSLSTMQADYLREVGFQAKSHELLLLPGATGVAAAVLGLGQDRSYAAFGDLAHRLPEGAWALQPGDYMPFDAQLGYSLGSYRFTLLKSPKRPPAQLVVNETLPAALSQASAINMARDLVNAPANLLGPAELAAAAEALAEMFGALYCRVTGADLEVAYPTIAAVGRGSSRPPVVASFTWCGSKAGLDSPHISLCGKGVVFDTGGLDLKPASGMLRMKKDMGGAASVLALARIIMEADMPVRLSVRIGCVENAVSGDAMRPLDVITTRRGLTVEIGNTDAEGRLVLCDLLAEASDEQPHLLIDAATLTGAARVALGPDLPALFCNDDVLAESFLSCGNIVADPMWRLPLWAGYSAWLDSPVADLNNVSSKPQAGAVVAALFLQRFVAPGVSWAHLDTYAWNDSSRPARPEGGEAMGVRAMAAAIAQFASAQKNSMVEAAA